MGLQETRCHFSFVAEAEYRGAVEASKEALWLRQIFVRVWLSAAASDYTLV